MVLALTIASFVLFIAFLFISLYLYKLDNKKAFDLRNHFPYEIYSSKNKPYGWVSIILLASLVCFIANYVVYMVKAFEWNSVLFAFLALAIAAFMVVLFYMPVARERAHLIVAFLFGVATLMLDSLLLFPLFRYRQAYQQSLFYIPVFLNIALVIVYLVFMFFPSLFNLKMEEKDGVVTRPKRITLCMFEWAIIFTALLSQISLLFIDILI